MKYIKKQREPKSLAKLRQTPGAKYQGPQEEWQHKLLEEQGYICAYCMARISLERDDKGKPDIGIEHYLSRKQRPDLDLDWNNMLGVCNGSFGIDSHCDKAQGRKNDQGEFIKGKQDGDAKLKVLNPRFKKLSEKVLKYSLSGEILPNTSNQQLKQQIKEDLDCILNLNDSKIRQARKNIIEHAKDRLKKKYPKGDWKIQHIDQEIIAWQSKTPDGKYKAYCQAAIWYLQDLKEKREKRITAKSSSPRKNPKI